MTAPDDYGACRDKGHQQDLPNAAWSPILQKMVFSIIEKCTFWFKIFKTTYKFSHFFFHFRQKHANVPANLKALRAANTNPANFVLHEITLIVVKGFFPKIWYPFERLGLSIRKNIAIRSNSYGYPFEKEMSSLWLELSVWIARAIRLKNSQPFKRLTSFRNHFCPNRLWRTWQKM